MKKLAAESERERHRKPWRTKPKKRKAIATVEIALVKDFDKLMSQIPREIRLKVMRPATREAAKFTKKQLQQALTKHDSSITGTELLQSWSTFNQRQQRRFDLRGSIHYKIRTYKHRVLGMVGPRRSEGNHAHLLERGYMNKLWGKGERHVPPTWIFRDTLKGTVRMQRAIIIREVRKRRFDA